MRERGSATLILLGILGVAALAVVGFLLYSLRDGARERRPTRMVIAGDGVAPPSPVSAAPEPSQSAAPPPEIHPRDPSVADPNGEYRNVTQHEWTKVSPGTWNDVERLARRKLSDSEKLRMEKLVNGWQEDLETYQRRRDEGAWDAAEFTRQSAMLTEAMKKRFEEMLMLSDHDAADRIARLFQ